MGNLLSSPTADRIARGYDLKNKVAVVTGAASGIGKETTQALAKRGALVFLTCRDLSAGHKAKRDIVERLGERYENQIDVMHLDLASLASIENFVKEFEAKKTPLHYLILNAAVMGVLYQLTREGFEMHFGVNYLGHFHLTQLMIPIMKQQTEPSCIVAVCCASTTRRMELKLTKIAFGKRQSYVAKKAYNQSKLALRFFAEELSIRLQDSEIDVVGADPGVTYTWIIKNMNPFLLSVMPFASIFMNTPEQGAATVVFACLDRRISSKVKPFCSHCRLLHWNVNRCKNPAHRQQLYEMSTEWIAGAVHDCCQSQPFDPKAEVWKSVAMMVRNLVHQRKTKKRAATRSEILLVVKYEKVD